MFRSILSESIYRTLHQALLLLAIFAIKSLRKLCTFSAMLMILTRLLPDLYGAQFLYKLVMLVSVHRIYYILDFK
jgi:hypothetical protein